MTEQTSAERVRDAIRDDLIARLVDKFQDIEGGPLDGVSVISRGNFDETVTAYFEEFELPEPTEHAAEVATPARVVTAMVCPNCRERQSNAVRIDSKLTIEGHTRKLTVHAKAATLDHTCGQQPLPMTDEVGTEAAFDIEDIVGDDEGTTEDDDDDKTEVTRHPFRVNRGGVNCITCGLPESEGNHE